MTDADLTAVILAAGAGRRLAPLTNRRPKPMLPVVNRPLLEHVVDAVVAAGIDEIVLVVGYERDRIQTHFGDGDDFGVSIRYAIQDKQLGTGHALQRAERLVEGKFLVLNGDRVIEPSIVDRARDALLDQDPEAVVTVTRVSDSSAYGVVSLEDKRVVDIVEKPDDATPSEFINAGVYGFTPSIFDAIRETEPGPDGEYGLPDAIVRLAEAGRVTATRYDGWWLDVSYPWDLLTVTGAVLDREGGETDGRLSPGAQIADEAHLTETASVGANASIGRGTTVGYNVRIESNTTIERSVVFPDATIGAGAVLTGCIVGENATVGPNVTVAGGASTIIIEGEVHDVSDFGGIVGDNAHVGGGAVLEAGTILGDDVTVGDGAIARGRIPDGVELRRG